MRAGQQQEAERLRSEVAAFQNELDRQKLRSDSAVARMQTRAAEVKLPPESELLAFPST